MRRSRCCSIKIGLENLFISFTAFFYFFFYQQPVCETLVHIRVFFHFLWQLMPDCVVWQTWWGERRGQREPRSQSEKADNSIRDCVSIDRHAIVIQMTISGLMAFLKGHSMNLQRSVKWTNTVSCIKSDLIWSLFSLFTIACDFIILAQLTLEITFILL